MRNWKLGSIVPLLAGILTAAWAFNVSAFSDGEALARWMATYYQAPQPHRLTEAVARFVKEPASLARPERLDAPAHFFGVIANENPAQRRELKVLAEQTPAGAQRQFVERVLNESGRIEFVRARDPNELDILWAHYAATGSPDAVRMVISALDADQREMNLTRPVWRALNISDRPEAARVLRSAAAWSLSKHAQSHSQVRQLLDKELERTTSANRRAQITGILDGKISLK